MTRDPFALWVYLAERPLLWLTVTLVAYGLADRLSQAARRHPLANPVLIAAAMIGAVLLGLGVPYDRYFDGAQFVHFLLGPATVALAVPLYENRHAVRRALVPMAAALVAGSVVTLVSAVLILMAFGVSPAVMASMAPKSVTAAIAMAVSEGMGGDPALTAVLVILTGIFGAMVGLPLLGALGLGEARAAGFAVGIAAHGIGTARALQFSPEAGAFAAIAMALNAVLTALLAPPLFRWLMVQG